MKRLIAILFAVLTLSALLSVVFPNLFPVSQEEARSWVESFKYDRLAFVAVQIIQVIVPPISHYFTSVLGGYMYGAVEGGILNYVGRVIGQFIAFGIAWKFGAAVRTRWLDPMGVEIPFSRLVNDEKNRRIVAFIVLAMIALPFFPDDELSWAMGLLGFPVFLFAVVTLVGHLLGSFALAFLGSGEDFSGPLFWWLAGATIGGFIVLIIGAIKYRNSSGSA